MTQAAGDIFLKMLTYRQMSKNGVLKSIVHVTEYANFSFIGSH